jgi:cation diffusion facilitator family transporter
MNQVEEHKDWGGVDLRPKIRRVLILTLILNILVVVLKGSVAFWTGSLSLMADALHSVTDGINNVLGLVASQFASPEPDREHPYGHQKFEALGALGIAAFLGMACYEILKNAIEQIIQGSDAIDVSSTELWILILVLGVNIFVAFYERSVGQKIGSPILIADAQHTMGDVWVTISVIGGLMAVWLWDYQFLDLILAFPVALLVFSSAWSVLKANLPWLVDEMAIAPEAIYRVVMSVPGVINCHHIASRGVVGRQSFIEMHLIVDANDIATAHQITEAVEERLVERYSPVRINIHVEPPQYESSTLTYNPGE